VEAHPQDWPCRFSLANTYRATAQLHQVAGRRDDAVTYLRKALDCWHQPCPLKACPLEFSSALASLGEIEAEAGNLAKALAHYRAAIAKGRDFVAMAPEEPYPRWLAGSRHLALGRLLSSAGQPDEGETHFGKAQEMAKEIIPVAPTERDRAAYRWLQTECCI